ncbi:hypothetical protein Taro_005183 [Colocasia esculenta]|uniref:ATPase AAA-type core domain-containing protein n=1 Tax=Colocasia esculenta TaxID=4460 RepID=A0A843TTP1_COLES|nr:hypothetical protein [Colocasia esculenta]
MPPSQDLRSRAAKPVTIHACAQSGDLPGLQRKLADNPSLLNERNPVVRRHFCLPTWSSVSASWVLIDGSSRNIISSCVLVLGFASFFLFVLSVGIRFASSGGSCVILTLTCDENCGDASCPIIMSQTPLHVAAGNNNTGIVKFLLDWKGLEKVEIEAKNMYGETPLHMAAKNGCNEAARLLLDHGASVEARANNGMTPLHLAVWHSLRVEDCSTVSTLLAYNADCSVVDKEEMTPLNYLSQGSNNEKLQKLLNQHIEEQRKRKALETCSEAKAKMAEFEAAMSNIVGLHDLKSQLHRWAKGMLLDEWRRALGLKVAPRRPPHMAFLGNPGTGKLFSCKTMVARLLGKLLYMVGFLPTDKVTEVQRTDLVGEFVGHTGPKTRRKIAPAANIYRIKELIVDGSSRCDIYSKLTFTAQLQEAEGGILFVDEAYRLIPMQKADDKDYGLEALEEIMSVMDSGKIVVIFAGYKEPMQRVISSNEGFCRRVTKFFYFDDFNSVELAQILHLKMKDQVESSLLYGFRLHPSCSVESVAELIEKETTEKQRKEMNGGLIDPLLVNARENLDYRLGFDCINVEDLLTITMEDLHADYGLFTILH